MPPVPSKLSTASIETVVKSVAENETWPWNLLNIIKSAVNRLMCKVETRSSQDICLFHD